MPSIPSKDDLKSLTMALYDDTTRPSLVKQGLVAVGVEKVLPATGVEYVASLTTYSGLKEKSSELYELAVPYLKKAKYEDGRKELVSEAKELVNSYVIEPATPFVLEKKMKVELVAAPYIAKVSTTKEAILTDKRVEKALEGIKHVREHPQEVVAELKAKAVDLIKYDDLASYREYVQSAEFQEDTRRLIQVELPAIAKDAASKGKEKLALAATTLQAEIEVKGTAMASLVKRGYEWGKTAEYEEMRATAITFVTELKAQIAIGIEQVKSGELTFSDIISKVTKAYIEFGAPEPLPAPEAVTEDAPAVPTYTPSSSSNKLVDDEE